MAKMSSSSRDALMRYLMGGGGVPSSSIRAAAPLAAAGAPVAAATAKPTLSALESLAPGETSKLMAGIRGKLGVKTGADSAVGEMMKAVGKKGKGVFNTPGKAMGGIAGLVMLLPMLLKAFEGADPMSEVVTAESRMGGLKQTQLLAELQSNLATRDPTLYDALIGFLSGSPPNTGMTPNTVRFGAPSRAVPDDVVQAAIQQMMGSMGG